MTSGRDDAVRVLQPQEPPKFLSDWCAQGVSDGFGDRLLMYGDNAEPAWEVLRIHHDLATAPGFREAVLQRLDQLSAFQHASFPKVRAVEDFAPGSAPLLASSHTPGRRLAEAFTNAGSVGLAMLLIRDLTLPLAALHKRGDGVAHGALNAGRITVTTDGRLVIRDHVFGSALEGLRFSPAQTWSRLGVVVPDGPRPASTRLDVLQVALIALSSLAGRAIGASDYPDRLEDLLDEFALFPPLRNWLEPALQVKEQGFESACDAEEAIARLFPEKLQGESQIRALLAAFAQTGAAAAAAGERPPTVRRFVGGVRVRPQIPTSTAESRRLIETRTAEYVEEPVAEPLDIEPTPVVVAETPIAAIPVSAPAQRPVRVAVDPLPAVDRLAVAPSATPQPATKKSPVLILQAEEARQAAEEEGRFDTSALAEPVAAPRVAPPIERVEAFAREAPSSQPVQAAVPQEPHEDTIPAFGRMSGWERRVRPAPAQPEAPAAATVSAPPPVDPYRLAAQSGSPRSIMACVAILALGQGVIISRLYFSPPVIVAPAVAAPTPAASAPVEYEASLEARTPAMPPEPAPPTPRPAVSAPAAAEAEAPAPRPQPVNAGGLRLTSPVELFAFEGDRLVGSTSGPIVLPPGRHDLELVNSALGFRTMRSVTIRAGDTATLRVEIGNGSLNINATPWAEVLVDGRSVGETPIGNLTVPLGEHEIVFRHPQLGEQRERVLVRSGAPTKVSVTLAR